MKDLSQGKEGKVILMFALPMLLGNVFQQMYNIVDSWVVGNFIGKDALAAVGASFPVIFVLISMVMGVTMGCTIIIAQYFGAKDYDKVKRAVDTMYIFLGVASVIMSVAGILLSEYIFRLIRLPENLIPSAKLYLDIFLAGMILMFGYNATSAALRGLGDSKTPMYFLMISTVVNVILCLLFVLVFKWGIAGVAIATVLAQGGSFLMSIIYLNKNHTVIRFSIKTMKFDKEIFYKSLKIGIPSGLQQTFVAIGMMALMRIVNRFGIDTIAAYTVAGRIDSFAMLPAMNFSAALSTFVGQNIGANKPERVKKGFVATLKMSIIFSICVSLLVGLFSHQLMEFFTKDHKVIDIGISYLVIVSSFYILFTSMFVVHGVLRGAGDTLIPMIFTLISLWLLRIPLAHFLSISLGSDGIWWAIPIAWATGLAMSYIYYKTGKWKKKAVVKYPVVEDVPEEII